MKIVKNTKFIAALSAILAVAATAYAATSTNGGTAPTIYQKGVEYIQTQFWTDGPGLTSKPILGVTYTYNYHRVCAYQDPISGACVYANALPDQRYLCMTTTQTGPINLAPDLRCVDNLSVGTHSTSVFNGVMINATSKRPRWYFGFIVNGAGSVNPAMQGRSDSVTVTW